MKPTLAMLVYTLVVSPTQVASLPQTLSPSLGNAQGPAGQAAVVADPKAPASLVVQILPPLVPPSAPPQTPNNDHPYSPTPVSNDPWPMKPEGAVPGTPIRPTPAPSSTTRLAPIPVPVADLADTAGRQNNVARRWDALNPSLQPAGPAAGYFVVQDIHGVWPSPLAGPVTPLAPHPNVVATADSPMPIVRASSHPLISAEPHLPVIYTARAMAPKASEAKTEEEPLPEKEIVWGAQDDYHKIVGLLLRVHVNGGRWLVRYAGLDKEDRYGGSVVLDSSAEIGKLAEGDVVCVEGEILNGGRAERPQGAPLYRVRSLVRVSGRKN